MFTWFRYFLWGVGLRLRFFKLDDGGDNDNAFVVLGEADGAVVVAAEAVDALNVLIDFREEGGDLLKVGVFSVSKKSVVALDILICINGKRLRF